MKKQPIFRSLFALALLLGVVWSCKKEETAVVPTPAVKSAAKDITKFSFAALALPLMVLLMLLPRPSKPPFPQVQMLPSSYPRLRFLTKPLSRQPQARLRILVKK